MTLTELEEAMKTMSQEEKQKKLRLERAYLLENIHVLQQKLDRIDYMIIELEKQSSYRNK